MYDYPNYVMAKQYKANLLSWAVPFTRSIMQRDFSGAEVQKTVPYIARSILFMDEKSVNKQTEFCIACLQWNWVEQVGQSFQSPHFLDTQF